MSMVKIGILLVLKSVVKFWVDYLTMGNFDFDRGHGQNLDYSTMVILKFWPWSWSKIFDHMTRVTRA